MPGTHKTYYPMSTRYRKGGDMTGYQQGGFVDFVRNSGPGIGQAFGTFGSFLPEDSGAGGFFSGAGSGAAAGSVFGPIGTGVGALVGGITGIFGAKKRREAEEERKRKIQEAKTRYNTALLDTQSDAILADYESQGTGTIDFKQGGIMKPFPYQDQNMSTGNLVINPTTNVRPQSLYDKYFQMGGEVEDIMPEMVEGGQLNRISNDAVMVNGNFPGMTDDVSIDGGQTYVDHGEVLKSRPDGVDIFSDTLKPPGSKMSFAKLAMKLEKQKNMSDPRFMEANERIEMKLNELFSMQQIMNGDSEGEPSNVPTIPGEIPGAGYDPNMNTGANMFMGGGKINSIYKSGGIKKFKYKYGGKLPAGRTQPSHGTFTPNWRRPSTATPAVNPHTTITTYTQSRKEPAVGMMMHKITPENNRPMKSMSAKPTQKKSKKSMNMPAEINVLLARVGELKTLMKSYKMGGEYDYQMGGEYYNEGMREAQIQVPYPGSFDYRKKKMMMRGFEHGGMSDMMGNSVAHPFGKIGYIYGGKSMLDNIDTTTMSYPGYRYGGSKKKSSYQLGGRNFNSFPTYGVDDYFNTVNSTLPMATGSEIYGRPEGFIGPPAPDSVGTVQLPDGTAATSPTRTTGVVSAPISSPRLLPITNRTPIGISESAPANVSAPGTLSPLPSTATITEDAGFPDGNRGFNFTPGRLRDALNVGSILGEYIANERRIDDIPEIPQPRLARSRRLSRTNINDQLNEIRRQGRVQQLAADRNTLPGAAQSVRGNILAKQIAASNQAYGQRDRLDAQIANQEAILNAQIDATNLNKLQQFDRDQVARDNTILAQRGQNFANLLTQARGLLGEASQKERDTLAMLLRTGADTTGSLEAMFKDNPELFRQYLPDFYKKLQRKWGSS